jgi:phosphoglycolate phosphatase
MTEPTDRGLAIFDYDGVIVDSLPLVLDFIRECHREAGRPATGDLDMDAIDNITYDAIGEAAGIPVGEMGRFMPRLFERFVDRVGDTRLFPGIAEMLEAVASRHIVAFVSANASHVIERVLDARGFGRHVARVYGADHPGDKAAKIRACGQRFGVPSDRTWMTGDAVSDVRSARAAGVRSIAVTWGWQSRERLARERPGHLADTPADVARILGCA